MTTASKANGTVECDQCGDRHVAEYSHENERQGSIFAVVCTVDYLTDYYTEERVNR